MSIVGHIPYLGRLDPYLRSIEVVDHIYVKGPNNCANDGINLFSSLGKIQIEISLLPDDQIEIYAIKTNN